MKSNKIILNLRCVQHAALQYINQEGRTAFDKPPKPTVRARMISPQEPAAYHPDYPGETMAERATRLDIWDTWTPVCTFQLAANHNVTYTGEKALSMWKAWNAKIFGKKK